MSNTITRIITRLSVFVQPYPKSTDKSTDTDTQVALFVEEEEKGKQENAKPRKVNVEENVHLRGILVVVLSKLEVLVPVAASIIIIIIRLVVIIIIITIIIIIITEVLPTRIRIASI